MTMKFCITGDVTSCRSTNDVLHDAPVVSRDVTKFTACSDCSYLDFSPLLDLNTSELLKFSAVLAKS